MRAGGLDPRQSALTGRSAGLSALANELDGVRVVLAEVDWLLPRMVLTTSPTAPSILSCTAVVTAVTSAATTPSSAVHPLVPVCRVASDVTRPALTPALE